MTPRKIVLIGTVLSAVLVGGSALLAAPSGDASVKIDNFSFSPVPLTVLKGTKVTWVNRDDIPHTVTDAGAPREFKSSPLDTGDAFSHIFTTAGTYHYFCSLHPHMQGTVVVR